ncbi:MAG: hypothetical protein HY676_04860 [Chloroflexi bacterium]|nr:hypothetical protein [Chloroflexota bacterium]
MASLAKAIRQERWDLAALCLLQGFLHQVAELPPDTVHALLEILSEAEDGRTG